MSTCPAVDYWHLAGTTYRLACELPAGHDNGGNDHLEAGELDAGGLRHLLGLRSEALARVAARAESAEAEVVTLRARLAAVEALTVDWPCSDDTCDGDCTGCSYASDLRAALAVTTGEGE